MLKTNIYKDVFIIIQHFASTSATLSVPPSNLTISD